jgi:hypothetical protein
MVEGLVSIGKVQFTYVPIVDEETYPGKVTMVMVNSYVMPKDRNTVKDYVMKRFRIESVLFCERS